MTLLFGWCLDGRHHLQGAPPETNEGRCPGKSHDGKLTCPCPCHTPPKETR